MKPHFQFISIYRGESDFQIYDDTGSYRAHLRIFAEPYDSKLHNLSPEDYRLQIASTVGLLRRSPCDPPIPAGTVRAFNQWRETVEAERANKIRAEWHRYAETPQEAEEWIRDASQRLRARGTCEWVQGPGLTGHWRILELDAESVAA